MTFFLPRKFGGNVGVLFMTWKVWGKWGDFFCVSWKVWGNGGDFFPWPEKFGETEVIFIFLFFFLAWKVWEN